MSDRSYVTVCGDCWTYYGRPPVFAIGILGGTCERCGKANDQNLPYKEDLLAGLHAVPSDKVIAKDGKLPTRRADEEANRKPFRIGIGYKGLEVNAPVVERKTRQI